MYTSHIAGKKKNFLVPTYMVLILGWSNNYWVGMYLSEWYVRICLSCWFLYRNTSTKRTSLLFSWFILVYYACLRWGVIIFLVHISLSYNVILIILQAAFPAQERRLDALMFCVNEIFLYLDENLKLTPQSMVDKAIPADELEDMHQRVCVWISPSFFVLKFQATIGLIFCWMLLKTCTYVASSLVFIS